MSIKLGRNMGADNKINKDLQDLQDVKDEFLSHDLNLNQDKDKIYSLEEEFVKSKKNRHFTFILLVSSFLLIVILIVVTSHIIMKDKERNFDIKITEFEDLKMKELVYSVGDDNNQLQKAKIELEELKVEHKIKKDELDDEYKRLEEEILAIVFSESKRNEKIQQLNDKKKNQLAQLEIPFQQFQQEKTDEIKIIESRIASNQKQFGSATRKDWDFDNPEQTLYELKLKKIRADYEEKIITMRKKHQQEKQDLILKYNPIFQDNKLQAIVNKPAKLVSNPVTFFSTNQDYISNSQLFSKNTIARLKSQSENLSTLISRLQKIPFHNSSLRSVIHLEALMNELHAEYNTLINQIISSYNPIYTDEKLLEITNKPLADKISLQAISNNNMEFLLKKKLKVNTEIDTIVQSANSISLLINRMKKLPFYNSSELSMEHLIGLSNLVWKSYDNIVSNLKNVITDSKLDIEQFNYFLGHLTRINAENGYILDPRNPQQISIFIDPAFEINEGDNGIIFRKDDQFIAAIRFVKINDKMKAELVNLISDKNIQPFDKILINKSGRTQ